MVNVGHQPIVFIATVTLMVLSNVTKKIAPISFNARRDKTHMLLNLKMVAVRLDTVEILNVLERSVMLIHHHANTMKTV
jgi:hypothetical protein